MALPRMSDPYRLLGVPRDATAIEIKTAHRELAKRFHPDAGRQGDTDRFLAIQEAYQLLMDPLRRREWDARHAAGPVRAGDPARRPSPVQRRRAAAADEAARASRRAARPTRSDTEGEAREEADGDHEGPWGPRDPRRDGYTWSARNVPWWEEDAPPGAGRRAPGRRRPHEPEADANGSPPDPAPGTSDSGSRSSGSPFDAFDRSSGAAWSSAARAHYRRSTADFASGASQPYAHRFTTPPGGPIRQRSNPLRPAPEGPSPRAATSARSVRHVRPTAPGRTEATAGTATTGDLFGGVRARTGVRSAAWPTIVERLGYGILGWVPLALLIAYGGGAVSGCAEASARCSPAVPQLQAAAIGALLVGLLAFPKAAYLGAAGGVGLLAVALALALVAAGLGIDRVPSVVLALAIVAMLAGYGIAVLLARDDRPVLRPWRRYASASGAPASGASAPGP